VSESEQGSRSENDGAEGDDYGGDDDHGGVVAEEVAHLSVQLS
jgi:hypothetical protein